VEVGQDHFRDQLSAGDEACKLYALLMKMKLNAKVSATALADRVIWSS
jgi:hypothetical protein